MTEQINGRRPFIPGQTRTHDDLYGNVTVLRPFDDARPDDVVTSRPHDVILSDELPVDAPAGVEQSSVTTAQSRPFVAIRIVRHRGTRAVVRQAVYVGAGALVARRHLRDEKTTARHQRMMRQAEAVNDHATALLWEERASRHRADRHKRRMHLLKHAPRDVARALVVGGMVSTGTLIILGVILAASSKDARDVVRPLMDGVTFVRLVAEVISVLWEPAVIASALGGLAALWTLGRRRAEVPAWLAPASQGEASVEITPSIVIVALRELGYADLRSKIKAMDDAGAALLGPIRIAGCGVEVDVELPHGTSTEEILKRRRKLAENLGRHEHELHITVPGDKRRTVRLWIADAGALDEPLGPSPLTLDATLKADYYTGRAPWGQDLRGDAAMMSLFQRHVLITGTSNQGKTAALRALLLWLALDPTVEFRIADLKGVGDLRMFLGLATTLIQGPTDAHVIATVDMVEGGVEEMERRLVALEKTGSPDGVTREMARKPGSGFHPLVIVVDESQVAFMCPVLGPDRRPYGGKKATSRFFMACRKLLNQGRAVNVTLILGTQDPTDENLPKLVREAFHVRASLFLGTESQAKMSLGETPVEQGAAPHKLRQGLDKGTLVVTGDGIPLPSGQSSVTVRTNYIGGRDAEVIADRAKRMRNADTAAGTEQVDERDVLADVGGVLLSDETLVKASTVVKRLRVRDPRFYAEWTVNRLTAALVPHAVVPRKTVDGTMHVDHSEVLAALDLADEGAPSA